MYIKPSFYDDFCCKADKCTDTCCAGWEVDIDDVTLEKYNSVQGDMKHRLNNSIIDADGQPCFRLDEKERCCFLSEKGLCDIYSALGEDYLCDICKEHPRFYDEFDGITQCGLGLCCEKVCEMLLECDSVCYIRDFEYSDASEDTQMLLETRDEMFALIYDNTKCFEKKITALIDYAENAEYELFGDESNIFPFADKKSAIEEVLSLYNKTEPINERWTEFLDALNNNISAIALCDYTPDFSLYEKLLSYIIYRHFMNCRFDGKIYNVVRFAVCSVIFIYASECLSFIENGRVTVKDRINAIKRWSQQIEYSQENTDMCLTSDI